MSRCQAASGIRLIATISNRLIDLFISGTIRVSSQASQATKASNSITTKQGPCK